MADDAYDTSDVSDPVGGDSPKEDAETKATREELKHTAISDRPGKPTAAGDETSVTAREKDAPRPHTPKLPALDTKHETLRDQISSPKKKRAHDEVDAHKDGADEADNRGNAKDDKSNDGAVVSRTDRTEPEKKRPRDKQVDNALKSTQNTEARFSPTPSDLGSPPPTSQGETAAAAEDKKTKPPSPDAKRLVGKAEIPKTSSSAFASSGFAKLTGSESPFGSLSGSSKPSLFGSSSSSPSPFSALGGAKPSATPKLSFGGNLNGQSTTFGGTFKSGFGSLLSGPKLSSFGKPGEVLKSDKPTKPFGAPISDAGEDSGSESEDEEGSERAGSADSEEKELKKPKEPKESKEPKEPKELKESELDDKKKPKLHRGTYWQGGRGVQPHLTGMANPGQ